MLVTPIAKAKNPWVGPSPALKPLNTNLLENSDGTRNRRWWYQLSWYSTLRISPLLFIAAGITSADVGKPVTLTPLLTILLNWAGANDVIYGNLKVVENRVQEGILVGTIEFKGGFQWTKSVLLLLAMALSVQVLVLLKAEVQPTSLS